MERRTEYKASHSDNPALDHCQLPVAKRTVLVHLKHSMAAGRADRPSITVIVTSRLVISIRNV
jgi:hypothetical protein